MRRLRKPSRPAWAVNQLARSRRRDLNRLLEAGAKLRKAHEQVLGSGDARALRKQVGRERELVETLVDHAREALADHATTGNVDRVRATLRAAASDQELSAQLAAGRLVRDREPTSLSGFGAPPRRGR